MNENEWPPGWDVEREGPPPPPLPLDLNSSPKGEPFPVHILPPVFRRAVRSVAANKQVPEDLPAMFGLSVIAALTGPRVAVSRGHGWTEPLNIYTCTVMDSGSGKSPAAADMIRPLRRLQKQLCTEFLAMVDSKIDALVVQRDNVGRDAGAANRIEDQIKELEQSKRMAPRIMLGSDSTIESVADFMARNGGHAAILDHEGEFFAILSGRYSKQVPNLGMALKAYDGDYYEVSRIGRVQDDMSRAILTLAFGVQPTVMESAAKDKAMVERGLLARFMFAVPLSMVGVRESDGEPYDAEAMAAWDEALTRIFALPVPEPDSEDFPTLRLSIPARKRHVDYCQWIEKRLHPDEGDLGSLPGWASKHKGRALRLAGLLHLIHGYGVTDTIGEQAMTAAIEICRWAVGHAIAVFGMGAPEGVGDDKPCQDVLKWIQRVMPKKFGLRDAQRGIRKNWVTKDAMAAAVDRLAALGYVTLLVDRDRAGRSCVSFVPHPLLLAPAESVQMPVTGLAA